MSRGATSASAASDIGVADDKLDVSHGLPRELLSLDRVVVVTEGVLEISFHLSIRGLLKRSRAAANHVGSERDLAVANPSTCK
jgi:hypothetical protein